MKNGKRLFGAMICVALTFGVIFIGCGGGATSVPSWAQGTWYTASSGTGRIKGAQITSTQYISYTVTGYDGSYNPIVSELMRVDCSDVSGDTISFGGTGANALQVKQAGSNISIGTAGIWITLYK